MLPTFQRDCRYWMSRVAPGYVSAAVKKVGANPTDVDFSKKMVAIASNMFPEIAFREDDAQTVAIRRREL